MLRYLGAIGMGTLAAYLCLAQSAGDRNGAKAIFLNSLTNEQIMSPQPSHPEAVKKSSALHRHVPAVTGILYYVELLQGNGELMRVNSGRIFHTGDRIRLHLNTNVTGSLVIYQSENGSKPEVLFPSGNLSGHVVKGTDIVLPSNRAWFVFDEHPGKIRLTLKLSADENENSGQMASTSAENVGALIAGADSVHSLQETEKRSKALKIETDDSPTGASQVVVVDSQLDPKVPPGQVAVEIDFIHQS